MEYPAGRRITQAWDAAVAQTGTAVTATNLPYNGTVPAGGSVTFGFNASWAGSNPPPTALG
ncbi:cellulose binding domain-containing protein, partial [Streptomyces roseolus]